MAAAWQELQEPLSHKRSRTSIGDGLEMSDLLQVKSQILSSGEGGKGVTSHVAGEPGLSSGEGSAPPGFWQQDNRFSVSQ